MRIINIYHKLEKDNYNKLKIYHNKMFNIKILMEKLLQWY